MPKWTPEEAREHAAAGGRAKAEKALREQKTPEQRAKDAFRAATPQLAKELLAAAKGDGVFVDLDLKERLSAVLRCLEYGIGRPAPAPRSVPAADPEEGVVMS